MNLSYEEIGRRSRYMHNLTHHQSSHGLRLSPGQGNHKGLRTLIENLQSDFNTENRFFFFSNQFSKIAFHFHQGNYIEITKFR